MVQLVFAVLALYIGFSVLIRITRNIDEEEELAKGNAAVGIVVAAVFVAIALVIESGVSGHSVGINRAFTLGIFTTDDLITVGLAIFQLILGIVLPVGSIYLALTIIDKLTKRVEEFKELKKGNIAVAWIIQSGVIGITAALG
jgi:uncharacterized membrane protein YjfL (UPF0719 family)